MPAATTYPKPPLTRLLAAALGAALIASPSLGQAVDVPAGPNRNLAPAAAEQTRGDRFEGYDFGHVMEQMEVSVYPLQQELTTSFAAFVESVEQAETLLEQGQPREAVALALAAIDGVLEGREAVLGPMWEGQAFLNEQTSQVRRRLGVALEAQGDGQNAQQLGEQAEQVLDGLARQIETETDPVRRHRLVMHYQTVRDMARIRAMANRLTPSQRQTWMSVLRLLDEVSLAHQQVILASELLFAQFETSSSNLEDYLRLSDTIRGASQLVTMLSGGDDAANGMQGFAQSMVNLQTRLAHFNQSIDAYIQDDMGALDRQLDSLGENVRMPDPSTPLNQIDAELAERIQRLE